jgi:SAM-dependent methyltransferase
LREYENFYEILFSNKFVEDLNLKMFPHRIKEYFDLLALPVYFARGRLPHTPGYYTAKRRTIENAIESGIFKDGSKITAGYGFRMDERTVEYPWLYSHLPPQPGEMLDAGSALNYEYLLDHPPVSIAKLTICTLAPEKRAYFSRRISYVYCDLRNSVFRSSQFDTIVSVSTLEHIGLDNTLLYTADLSKRESDTGSYLEAVQEFRRLIKPRGNCYISVPYGRPFNGGWFQVFGAEGVESIIKNFAPSWYSVDYYGYFQEGWRKVKPDEIADAVYFDINTQKSFDKDFAAGSRGVACLWLKA